MDPKLYKVLGICNAENCWLYARDVIAAQLMGENVFPVPFLRYATSFDIGYMILKGSRTPLKKLTRKLSVAFPVGQLSNFVSDPEHNLMQRLGKVRKDEDHMLNQTYEFYESGMKHGVKKTITIQLWGCEKWSMEYIPKTGELVVDLSKKGYIDIDRIYLITDVYYATEVRIHISYGDIEDSYFSKDRIPVGFSLLRYKLQSDGRLGLSKRKKTSSWHARWIRNVMYNPLPLFICQTSKGLPVLEAISDK